MTTTLSPSVKVFPVDEVKHLLYTALTRLGEDNSAMREPWEPTFDSLAVVDIVVVVERALPDFKIEPEKVVRKGGYGNIDEAVDDITARLNRRWLRQS